MLDAKTLLSSVAPRVRGRKATNQTKIIAELALHFEDVCHEFEISTPLRQAHFVAQLAHESDGFCTLEEYASGRAYEGRRDLGNTNAGDGVRFKGRGPIQITGRYNYTSYGKELGLDLVSNPKQAATAEIGLQIAGLYWHKNGLNRLADRNNVKLITRRINGGYNGLTDRRKYLDRAMNVLGIDPPQRSRLMKMGSRGADVRILQERLNSIHYFVGREDAVFGSRTDDQVRAFQRDNSLTIDGKVLIGGETWDALALAVKGGARREVFEERAQASAFMLASEGSRIASANIRGAGSSILGGITAGSVALSEATGILSESSYVLSMIKETFGSSTNLLVVVLVLAAGYSLYQHIRSARARTEDHQRGKTA